MNLSAYRLNYWILAYILHDPRLLASIRSEIALAFQTPDVNYRHIYESCPRLYAVFNEALRCSSGSVTTRNVEAPMTMQGRTIRPGSTIMVPIRELHSNAEIFGANVNQFDADRFLGKKLDKSPYFMPFGGGVTYCPGRFLAKRLSLSFVATMLERFEILIVDKNGVAKGAQALRAPDMDHVTPNMGIMKPVKGQETYINLLERKHG